MNLILLDVSDQDKDAADTTGAPDAASTATADQNDDNGPPYCYRYRFSSKDPRAMHICRRLKKTKGDRVRVGILPGGPIGEAVLLSSPLSNIHLQVLPKTLRPPPSRPCLKLLLGIPYPKVIAQLWPVLTSFLVTEITYAPATLTDPNFLACSALTPQKYTLLIREGLAQAEDTQGPKVTISRDATIVETIAKLNSPSSSCCCKIVLHIGNYPSLRQCYASWWKHAQPNPIASTTTVVNSNKPGILLAIGPERGWTDDEVHAFQTAGFHVASLGAPILRTDTAIIAGVALARDVLTQEEE